MHEDVLRRRRILLGLSVGILFLAARSCKQKPWPDGNTDDMKINASNDSAARSASQSPSRKNDGGYNAQGLPPELKTSTYTARYYRGESGWGPAPALDITCLKCGKIYGSQSRKVGDLPNIEETKVWMRRSCPNGQINCAIL